MKSKLLAATGTKQVLASIILIIWLLLAAFFSWQFFFASSHEFSTIKTPYFAGKIQLMNPKMPTMIHFTDASCDCNRFSEAHIQQLIKEYRDFRHIRVSSPSHTPKLFKQHDISDLVVSTPSVALFDAKGDLRYYGPYSDGYFCGQGKDLVSAVVQQMDADQTSYWLNLIGFGCYCPW